MNGEKVAVQKGLLPDGRIINKLRIKNGQAKFSQETIFPLIEQIKRTLSGLTVMTPVDHQIANECGAWEAIDVSKDQKVEWATRLYAVYPRGFERDLNMSLGEKVIWVEKDVSRTFEVPDVSVTVIDQEGRANVVGLRQTAGMAVFDVYKLKYDPERRIVSVTIDFDPAKDVSVVDVMRPRNYGLVDASGIPLRSKPAEPSHPEAKIGVILDTDNFDRHYADSTGYHGSIVIPSPKSEPDSKVVLILESWSVEHALALVKAK